MVILFLIFRKKLLFAFFTLDLKGILKVYPMEKTSSIFLLDLEKYLKALGQGSIPSSCGRFQMDCNGWPLESNKNYYLRSSSWFFFSLHCIVNNIMLLFHSKVFIFYIKFVLNVGKSINKNIIKVLVEKI